MIQFDAPLQGVQAASSRLNTAAGRISRAANPNDHVDLSAEMVALLEAKNATAANVKVAQAMDDMSRNLLNIMG